MLRMGKCVAKSHEIWAPSSLTLPTDPHDAALLFDVRILKDHIFGVYSRDSVGVCSLVVITPTSATKVCAGSKRKSDVQKYALCGQPMGKKHIRRVNQRGCTTVVLLV